MTVTVLCCDCVLWAVPSPQRRVAWSTSCGSERRADWVRLTALCSNWGVVVFKSCFGVSKFKLGFRDEIDHLEFLLNARQLRHYFGALSDVFIPKKSKTPVVLR